MENFSEIRKELSQLHNRTQETRTDLRVHQMKFEERHLVLLEKMEKLKDDMNKLDKKLDVITDKFNNLNDLATKGKSSLMTLWFIGGLAVAGLGMLATWLDIFNK